jgi:hypothetical protein
MNGRQPETTRVQPGGSSWHGASSVDVRACVAVPQGRWCQAGGDRSTALGLVVERAASEGGGMARGTGRTWTASMIDGDGRQDAAASPAASERGGGTAAVEGASGCEASQGRRVPGSLGNRRSVSCSPRLRGPPVLSGGRPSMPWVRGRLLAMRARGEGRRPLIGHHALQPLCLGPGRALRGHCMTSRHGGLVHAVALRGREPELEPDVLDAGRATLDGGCWLLARWPLGREHL